MPQGWVVDHTADTITFLEAPPVGVNNVVVTERPYSGYNATDIWAFGAWNDGFGYPSEVEFFSDRLIFAGSRLLPQTMWMSKTGAYNDFGKNVPLIDDDAITMTINARQVQAIRELVPLSDLIVMTTSAEWRLTTNSDGVVAPGKVGFKPQTHYGTANLSAQIVGETAVFVQGRGNIARDMNFEFTRDGYVGNDLTVYANHLIEGFTIVDWAYQQVPYSALWIVRSDGALICLTYLREQEVVGWSLHTTDGRFESVCTVPEGESNAVYVTVRRTIGGVERVYLERLQPRDLTDQRDAFFVDSGLTYDGRDRDGTITITGGVDWTTDEELTATSSAGLFNGPTDVGDELRLYIPAVLDENGDVETARSEVRFEIIQFVNANEAKVRANRDVPVAYQGVAFADWEFLRDTFQGLAHLEGKEVAVLADANVQGRKTVTGGQITLDHPAAVVHVGLPYRSLIESLDINVPGAETVRDRPKLINGVSVLVKDTRGCYTGATMATLDEFKQREFEPYEDATTLYSGVMHVNTTNTWDKNGRFFVVQEDPLPVTILSLIPDVAIAGVG